MGGTQESMEEKQDTITIGKYDTQQLIDLIFISEEQTLALT